MRARACDLAPDSDLVERLVTQSVGKLSADEVCEALAAGIAEAEALCGAGLICAAALNLQGEVRVAGAGLESNFIGASRVSGRLVHA